MLFAEKYPGKISSLVLVGAPVNLQEASGTILNNSKNKYQETNDSSGLNAIAFIEKLDTTSLYTVHRALCRPQKTGHTCQKTHQMMQNQSILR